MKLLSLFVLVCVPIFGGGRYPVANQMMTLDSTGRHLYNSITGQPVFLVGDDGFDLGVMLTPAEVTVYLEARQNLGFNAVWATIADNGFQTAAPKNAEGYAPFNGADFTNENANYFANIDSMITQAGDHGITVFLMPFFVGNGGEAGYQTSLQNASSSTLTAFGTFLGNRYKARNNIVWVLGGDSIPSHAKVYSQLNILGSAIAAADPNHLITLEGCEQCVTNGYNSVAAFQAAGLAVPSWLSLNWAYPQYTTTVAAANIAYEQSPYRPPICGENFYELENSMTERGLRFEMYSEVLSGCYLGRIFGNGAIWSFDSRNGSTCCRNGIPTWETQLSSIGSVSQEWQAKLFRSREHWLLVPDIKHTVVTAGYGSGVSQTTAARTSDGQTIIAYVPNGSATTITVDMAQIESRTGSVRGWWFNPITTGTTNLGTFANTGSRKFTPPNSNDWVLVLDDASAALAAPGTKADF